MVSPSVGWLVPNQTASGVRCFVHKTTDGGATWSDTILVDRGKVVCSVKPMRGTNNLLALGYLGNDPKAWWSKDGGVIWTDISPDPVNDGADLRNASILNGTIGYVTGLYRAMKFSPNVLGVDEPGPGDVPVTYALRQNYPNPFNPSTTIEYSIPRSDRVSLKVFNLLGQEIATLVNEVQAAGTYAVSFNASSFPSGVYFYRLEAGKFSVVRKMAIVK
jgi:hypothetical protein